MDFWHGTGFQAKMMTLSGTSPQCPFLAGDSPRKMLPGRSQVISGQIQLPPTKKVNLVPSLKLSVCPLKTRSLWPFAQNEISLIFQQKPLFRCFQM